MRTSTAAAVSADCGYGIRSSMVIRTVGLMIEVEDVTKRYGSTVAVSGLSFAVQPGHVTGFLGPNGSCNRLAAPTTHLRALARSNPRPGPSDVRTGKSTTMRLIPDPGSSRR